MRKKTFTLILLFLAISGTIFILTREVTYRQGMNYRVYTRKIPLYLKLMDYFTRHLHYKILVSEIIKEKNSDLEKISTLFKWTHENIKQNIPDNYPIVDDHVLNIIIRRYGTDDQSQDVFTTLCTYAGFRAYWLFIKGENIKPKHIAISLVQLKDRWLIFDSYRGNYFLNNKGEIASVEDIENTLSICSNMVSTAPFIEKIDYKEYFANLNANKTIHITRAEEQIPAKRIVNKLKSFFFEQ